MVVTRGDARTQPPGVGIPAQAASGCVNLDKFLNLSGPQFPHVQRGAEGIHSARLVVSALLSHFQAIELQDPHYVRRKG